MSNAVQISNGDRMTAEEIREGFEDPLDLHPEYSMFYGYAHSAMRAVTVIKKKFDSGGAIAPKNYTNGKIMMMGASGGSITSLIVNGVDDRLKGAIAFVGMSGFKDSWAVPGAWLARLVTDDGDGQYSVTIDCTANPTGNAAEACRMADYMDPINYTPNAPVLLLHGTQDEHLPLRTFKRTKDTLTAAGSQPVYSFLISDLDHHWYIQTWHYCPQNYFNALGVTRAIETFTAFFKKGIDDALSDFGDQTPGIMIRVSTEGIQKRYRTIVAVDDEVNLDYDMMGATDGIRIGLSGTKFFHVYPGLNTLGLPDQGDIPTMTVMASCTANHKCFERSAYYGLSEEPEYFGSFAQIHYRQTYNGEELSWYLTSDVISAGTSGETVMTFEPDIRCYFYEIGNPDCECDDSVAPEGEEDVMSGALGL